MEDTKIPSRSPSPRGISSVAKMGSTAVHPRLRPPPRPRRRSSMSSLPPVRQTIMLMSFPLRKIKRITSVSRNFTSLLLILIFINNVNANVVTNESYATNESYVTNETFATNKGYITNNPTFSTNSVDPISNNATSIAPDNASNELGSVKPMPEPVEEVVNRNKTNDNADFLEDPIELSLNSSHAVTSNEVSPVSRTRTLPPPRPLNPLTDASFHPRPLPPNPPMAQYSLPPTSGLQTAAAAAAASTKERAVDPATADANVNSLEHASGKYEHKCMHYTIYQYENDFQSAMVRISHSYRRITIPRVS